MPKSITISPHEGYHALSLKEVPAPVPTSVPKPHQVLLRIFTAALNHRDVYIRQNLYPAISFDTPLFADGCAIVLPYLKSAAGPSGLSVGQRVLINPGAGWASDPVGPEGSFAVLGGTSMTPLGTLQEMVAVPADDVALAPKHLSEVEAAALPLTSLTAWRAFNSKSDNAEPGRNILVTGIGGGVALMVLLFAAAKGCNVYVTSSSKAKINRAKDLGAKDGVVYTDEEGWPKALRRMLPEDRPYLDAVIDGAGGDIVGSLWKLLKPGGVIVSYGMTSIGQPALPMQAVMKNIELKGSTMGSRKKFVEMLRFVSEKGIRPVVGRVVGDIENIEAIEGLFEEIKEGKQFGKLVVEVGRESKSDQSRSHL